MELFMMLNFYYKNMPTGPISVQQQIIFLKLFTYLWFSSLILKILLLPSFLSIILPLKQPQIHFWHMLELKTLSQQLDLRFTICYIAEFTFMSNKQLEKLINFGKFQKIYILFLTSNCTGLLRLLLYRTCAISQQPVLCKYDCNSEI